MAVPWAAVFAASAAVAAVGIPLVYVLSRALKITPRPIGLENPRREAVLAVVVVLATYAIMTVVYLSISTTPRDWTDPGILLLYLVTYAPFLAVVFVAARATHQSWPSIGLSWQAPLRMVVLGLVPSVVFVLVVGFFNFDPAAGLPGAIPLAISYVAMTIVGFGEEIAFRGYAQTRFEAAWGTWTGYSVTVVLFTFFHFPGSYVMLSDDLLLALLSTLGRLGPALLAGYFYMRSRNVVPGAIFHLFYNWANVLWQVPSA